MGLWHQGLGASNGACAPSTTIASKMLHAGRDLTADLCTVGWKDAARCEMRQRAFTFFSFLEQREMFLV